MRRDNVRNTAPISLPNPSEEAFCHLAKTATSPCIILCLGDWSKRRRSLGVLDLIQCPCIRPQTIYISQFRYSVRRLYKDNLKAKNQICRTKLTCWVCAEGNTLNVHYGCGIICTISYEPKADHSIDRSPWPSRCSPCFTSCFKYVKPR